MAYQRKNAILQPGGRRPWSARQVPMNGPPVQMVVLTGSPQAYDMAMSNPGARQIVDRVLPPPLAAAAAFLQRATATVRPVVVIIITIERRPHVCCIVVWPSSFFLLLQPRQQPPSLPFAPAFAAPALSLLLRPPMLRPVHLRVRSQPHTTAWSKGLPSSAAAVGVRRRLAAAIGDGNAAPTMTGLSRGPGPGRCGSGASCRVRSSGCDRPRPWWLNCRHPG